MALGNANTSAQARGKNKPVVVKRRKEVVMAKNYNSFQIHESDFAGVRYACEAAVSCNMTVYHNGNDAVPRTSDSIYTRPRANEKYLLKDGYYKASIGGANNYLSVVGGVGQGKFGTCR